MSFASSPFAKGTFPSGQRGMAPGGSKTEEGSEGGREEGVEDEDEDEGEEAGKPRWALEEG